MEAQVYSRQKDKRYLGNNNEEEVHDLERETKNCQNNEILSADHPVIFIQIFFVRRTKRDVIIVIFLLEIEKGRRIRRQGFSTE
jgi:hypothetical protein